MNRAEFMRQLEWLLTNISPAEREEALQYYNDYFDDAGTENEQAVIGALGTPAKVAENIKRDLYGRGDSLNYDRQAAKENEVIAYEGQEASKQEKAGFFETHGNASAQTGSAVACRNGSDGQPGRRNKLSTGWMIVIVVAASVLFRRAGGLLGGVAGSLGGSLGVAGAVFGGIFGVIGAAFGIFGGLLGCIIGLAAGWFGLIIGLSVATLVLLILMIVFLIIGIVSLFVAPLGGLLFIAAALVCGGLGLLALAGTIGMVGYVTPAICRGIGRFCRWITGKRKAGAKHE